MSRISSVVPIKLRMPAVFVKKHLVGARPGSLAISRESPKPILRLIQYSREQVTDRLIEIDELDSLELGSGVTWLDVQGLGDEATLRAVARRFEIVPLALEDMVNVPQRPQITSYGDQLLWITRMVRIDSQGVVDREQVSILHTKRALVTFQQRVGDVFDPVRSRIADGTGRLRVSGADYLAYALVDTVVDGYYPVLQSISDTLESLEVQIMDDPRPEHLAAINQTRLVVTTLRRNMVAQRTALRAFLDDPTPHVEPEQLMYFKDTLDHASQLSSVLENVRELVAGLLNTYLSMVSYRANEVMKVLTIMASIFIPMTFLAGIYGMNFQHMPELSKPWAYPVALGVMVLVALGMVIFFVRKGWIGRRRRKEVKAIRSSDDSVDVVEKES